MGGCWTGSDFSFFWQLSNACKTWRRIKLCARTKPYWFIHHSFRSRTTKIWVPECKFGWYLGWAWDPQNLKCMNPCVFFTIFVKGRALGFGMIPIPAWNEWHRGTPIPSTRRCWPNTAVHLQHFKGEPSVVARPFKLCSFVCSILFLQIEVDRLRWLKRHKPEYWAFRFNGTQL